MKNENIKSSRLIRSLKYLLLYIGIALALVGILLSFPAIRNRLSGNGKAFDPSLFSVHCLDVGQGDCMLLLSESGEAALIDAGTDDNAPYILAYLKKHKVDRLTYFFITHPHTDHMGSASAILEEIPVGKLIHNGSQSDSYPAELLRKLIEEKETPSCIPSVGDRFSLGSGIIEVLSEPTDLLEENDNSLVLKLTVGENAFLFMGDCEEEGELRILSHPFSLTADVLKVGHHGSSSGTTDILLSRVRPQYAVISAGRNNDYGHPHISVLNRLDQAGAEVLITAEDGNIVFQTDGTTVTLYSPNRR